jgi:hypothetical protein
MKSFKFNLTAVTAVTMVNVFELKEKNGVMSMVLIVDGK